MSGKKTIPVAVLGATGSVGQKFIQLLNEHPFFEIAEVAASERSAGKTYAEAVQWILRGSIPEKAARLVIKESRPPLQSKLVFSGLDSSVAGPIESAFAQAGHMVVSNAKNHRFAPDVPLLIPEVNPEHLKLLDYQSFGDGKIVTNPNCSTIGLSIALKPLQDAFGLEAVNVTTMQAISGAGFPGLSALSILDNVIPHIPGEEEKLEQEPLKILGTLNGKSIVPAKFAIDAQCLRVAVRDGHTGSVQVTFKRKPTPAEIIKCWQDFSGLPQKLRLPLAPKQAIRYFSRADYPQPKLHAVLEKGMAVSVGGLRPARLFDYKFTVLSHNTVRGAAGGAILCAELMTANGLIDG